LLKRIIALMVATVTVFGLGTMASGPASASPGHVTIGCGVGNSSGWINHYFSGNYYGQSCVSIVEDGQHVDATYWVYDVSADGWDIDIYRDLDYISDGFVKVASASGYGTYGSVNKQYDADPGLQCLRYRVTADQDSSIIYLWTSGWMCW